MMDGRIAEDTEQVLRYVMSLRNQKKECYLDGGTVSRLRVVCGNTPGHRFSGMLNLAINSQVFRDFLLTGFSPFSPLCIPSYFIPQVRQLSPYQEDNGPLKPQQSSPRPGSSISVRSHQRLPVTVASPVCGSTVRASSCIVA